MDNTPMIGVTSAVAVAVQEPQIKERNPASCERDSDNIQEKSVFSESSGLLF